MANLYRDGACLIIGTDGASRSLERIEFSPGQSQQFSLPAYDEAWLQERIHLNPECLPISEIESGLGPFCSVAREVPTSSGYIDNLLMSGMGDVAIVEVKLFRNHEARRKVLAQILDYAAALFGMDYSTFEQAVLNGSALRHLNSSLYNQLADTHRLPECEFIDAVSKNLARGKMLLLIVGDGIRSELQRMIEQLEVFGQMRFTLAVVELAVHHLPDGGYLIRPSTLAKTEFIKRPVLEIVKAADLKSGLSTIHAIEQQRPDDMTSDAYWTALEAKLPGARLKLEKFLEDVSVLGVYPEFKASLNLRWDLPTGDRPINLSYIQKSGAVWTDATAWFAPADLARTYVAELAAAWEGESHVLPTSQNCTVYRNGRPIRLADILDKLDRWPPIIQRFQQAINERLKDGAAQPSPSSVYG